MESKIKILRMVLNRFSGTNGEPKGDIEKYILFSMWVMAISEFEGSIKNLIEGYIFWIRGNKKIEEVHPVLLINAFYKGSEEISSVKFTGLYSRDLKKITYENFTGDKKPKNQHYSIISSFNKLGIYFEKSEESSLKKIESITNTRNKIAHGDYESVSITKNELESNLDELIKVFKVLEDKISSSKHCKNNEIIKKKSGFFSCLNNLFRK